MHVLVNGERRSFDQAPASLEALLETLSLPRQRVAVELNGRLVRRDDRPGTPVSDGDVLEIVTLVGGG